MSETGASQIFKAFEEGLKEDSARRQALLDRYFPKDIAAKQKVEGLWLADDHTSDEVHPISAQAMNLLFQEHMPVSFGDFENISNLARGGMGMVYRARQKSLNREVAIKTLFCSWEDRAVKDRFNREVKHLAAMAHPNIATVYGADQLPDRRPFFYMEYLEGERLDHWCSGRSWQDCLRVFIQICDGVVHAHQKGIVHRDLKPSNILVVDGTPKIIDFGLATIAEEAARPGGTRGFMAPEASLGLPDTRLDIFALGRVFQDVMGGRSDVFSKPEIGAVLAKATAESAEARYASCSELQKELIAYTEFQPVMAYGLGLGYRLRKWTLRHMGKLAGAFCLVVFFGVVLLEKYQDHKALLMAEREIEISNHFMGEVLISGSPQNYGRDIRASEILTNVVEKLETFEGDDVTKAVIVRTVGLNYLAMGQFENAKAYFNQTLRLMDSFFQRDHPKRLSTQLHLAYISYIQGDYQEALQQYRQIMTLSSTAGHKGILLTAKSGLALSLSAVRSFEEAERLYVAVLSESPQATSDERFQRLIIRENMAKLYRWWGKHQKAESILDELLEDCLDRYGIAHGRTLAVWQELLVIQEAQGKAGLNEQQMIWNLRQEVLGPSHPDTLESLNTYANMHGNDNPLAAIALLELGLGEAGDLKHPTVVRMRHNLGHWLMAIDPEKAELVLRQTLADRKALLGERHQDTLRTACTLGETLLAQDCLYEAETLFEATHRLAKASLGEDHPESLVYQALLGVTLKNQGRQLEAQPMIQASYDGLKAAGSGHARWVGREL